MRYAMCIILGIFIGGLVAEWKYFEKEQEAKQQQRLLELAELSAEAASIKKTYDSLVMVQNKNLKHAILYIVEQRKTIDSLKAIKK